MQFCAGHLFQFCIPTARQDAYCVNRELILKISAQVAEAASEVDV